MKTLFSKIFVISIFSALIGTFSLSVPTVLMDENRMRARFPVFDIRHSFRRFFSEVDQFAVDNFPFRQYAIDGYRIVVNAIGGQVDASRAYRGRDGWFFLGNHIFYNQSVDKLEGKIDPFSLEPTFAFAIIDLAEWFQSQGVSVSFLLAPNKSSIYPEKLPAIVKPAKQRYVDRSLNLLRDAGIIVIDPTVALLERKKIDNVYYARDTHWNQIGASVAFEEVANSLGIHNCPAYSFNQIEDVKGDLVSIGAFEHDVKNTYDNFEVLWKEGGAIEYKIIDNSKIPYNDLTRFFKNSKPTIKQNIWIIGDSFSGSMLMFFFHCFATTGFIHWHRNTLEEIKQYYLDSESKPSYVLIELVERTF